MSLLASIMARGGQGLVGPPPASSVKAADSAPELGDLRQRPSAKFADFGSLPGHLPRAYGSCSRRIASQPILSLYARGGCEDSIGGVIRDHLCSQEYRDGTLINIILFLMPRSRNPKTQYQHTQYLQSSLNCQFGIFLFQFLHTTQLME